MIQTAICSTKRLIRISTNFVQVVERGFIRAVCFFLPKDACQCPIKQCIPNDGCAGKTLQKCRTRTAAAKVIEMVKQLTELMGREMCIRSKNATEHMKTMCVEGGGGYRKEEDLRPTISIIIFGEALIKPTMTSPCSDHVILIKPCPYGGLFLLSGLRCLSATRKQEVEDLN